MLLNVICTVYALDKVYLHGFVELLFRYHLGLILESGLSPEP